MRLTPKSLLAILSGLYLGVLSQYGDISFGVQHASAQLQNISQQNSLGIMDTAVLVMNFLHVLGYICIWMIGMLFDPLIIFGDADTGETLSKGTELLNSIWRFSRDIMNVIFAFILAAGAIVTVVTADSQYIRDKIIKFLLAVILVNFSWFFPRVILDIANVTAATVIQLPSMVTQNNPCKVRDGEGGLKDCVVITHLEFFPKAPRPNDAGDTCPSTSTELAAMRPYLLVCLEPLSANTNTTYGIINGLVLNHARLKDLALVCAPTSLLRIDQAPALLVTTLITVFFSILLVFPMLAIVAMMIVRIPILWLTISFMPFAFIGFLVPIPGFDTKDMILKKFMTAAFLPVALILPFAIGYIMLNNTVNPPGVAFTKFNEPMTPIICNINTFWGFLWMITAYAVIWSGVFMASRIDPIYEKTAAGFKSVGERYMKLPLNIPFLPAGTTTDKDGNTVQVKRSINQNLDMVKNPKVFFDDGIDEAGAGDGTKRKTSTPEDKINNVVNNNRVEFKNTFNGILGKDPNLPTDQAIMRLKDQMRDKGITDREGALEIARQLKLLPEEIRQLEEKLRRANIN